MKLKTKLNIIFFTSIILLLMSFGDPILKKRITDKEFKYEFYTTSKKPHPKNNVYYYWFKGGSIHNSQEGIVGELLDGSFDKFYLNNQLAEKGTFKKGKKIGKWKTWHQNGTISSEQEWAGGQKNGWFKAYNSQGVNIEKGLYRTNKKQGQWIVLTDTLKYQNDAIIIKKIKKTKEQKKADSKARKEKKLKKKEEKESKKENSKKTDSKSNNTSNKQTKNTGKTSSKKDKKSNFFNKLFSKKEKTKQTNAKGS